MNPAFRRKIATSVTLFLLAVSTLLAGYRGGGKASVPACDAEPLVTFALADARTDDAMQLLADRHGARLLFDEKMPERITCTFKKVKLSEALLSLAGPDRYCVLRDGKIYRVMTRLDAAARTDAAPAPKEPEGKPQKGAFASVEPAAAGADQPFDPGKVRADEALEFLSGMIDAGRYAEAEPLLLGLAKDHPEDARVHALLGNLYHGRKMLGSARRAWKQSLKLDPANAAARNGAIQLDKVIETVRIERAKTTDRTLVKALDAYLM